MFKLRVDEGAPPGLYSEGQAKVLVREGVFYNIYAEQSRTLTVIFTEAYAEYSGRTGLFYCEPLAASGVRGIRIALEAPSVDRVCLNDLSKEAYSNIVENIRLNGVEDRVLASREDANLHLLKHAFSRRPDIVDIDPFGSPMPFMAAAVQAIRHGGMIAATATDIAPLCGVHGRSTFRKYGAKPLKTSFCRELAVRIVLGAIARIAAIFDAGIKPLASHSTRHYLRVYVEVVKRTSAADRSMGEIGFLAYCPQCEWRSLVRGLATALPKACENCGSPLQVGGPLWVGPISDPAFLERAVRKGVDMGMGSREVGLVSMLLEESIEAPPYYQLDEMASKMGASSPPVKRIVEALRERGYRASRTHFDPKGIKTDAPYRLLMEMLTS